MKQFDETARIFYPQGTALAEGANFKQPELARTLQSISDHGRAGFYEGWVAQALVD